MEISYAQPATGTCLLSYNVGAVDLGERYDVQLECIYRHAIYFSTQSSFPQYHILFTHEINFEHTLKEDVEYHLSPFSNIYRLGLNVRLHLVDSEAIASSCSYRQDQLVSIIMRM